MIDATTLYHTTLQYNGVLPHNGVLSTPTLRKIINRTAPKRARMTDGDLVRAITAATELSKWTAGE